MLTGEPSLQWFGPCWHAAFHMVQSANTDVLQFMLARKEARNAKLAKRLGHAEFSDAFLDNLQQGVVPCGPCVLKQHGMCVYYKHGREQKRSHFLSPSVRKSHLREKLVPYNHKADEENIPINVKKAYVKKRALWKKRCKRATGIMPIDSQGINMSDAQVAWQERLQESRCFVQELTESPAVYTSSGSLRAYPTQTTVHESTHDVPKGLHKNTATLTANSNRNFRKTAKVRRNGVSISSTVRSRVCCEKRRVLQGEAQARDRNAENVRDTLRSLSQISRERLFLMIGEEARSAVGRWFPWLSSKARSQVVQTIYAEGQLRRKKNKRRRQQEWIWFRGSVFFE